MAGLHIKFSIFRKINRQMLRLLLQNLVHQKIIRNDFVKFQAMYIVKFRVFTDFK